MQQTSPYRHLSEGSETEASTHITFTLLLNLRWGAVIAQALLVFAVYYFLKLQDLPYRILMFILAFECATNIFFAYLKNKKAIINEWIFATVMVLDVMLLTLLLHYSGGPMNPFTFLYLIHITIGAIIMRPLWAWCLAAFTTICYALLFYMPANSGISQPCHPVPSAMDVLSDPMQIHLQGMWVAFAITAFFIVFFVGRIQRALAKHQNTLSALAAEKMRSEKLASLATLAAGAAHEFSTPLSTIAVAAGEMHYVLKDRPDDHDLVEDATLIRDQVSRCKDILYQMAADAGEHLGEEMTEFYIESFVDALVDKFPQEQQDQIIIHNNVKGLAVRMPLRTLGRIVRGLIKNGLDATTDDSSVALTCSHDSSYLYFEVSDKGTGMDQEKVRRATEPFYTTKEPGKGLGLGLFLAKSAAERFGGDILLHSSVGGGSRVTLSFALEHILAQHLEQRTS